MLTDIPGAKLYHLECSLLPMRPATCSRSAARFRVDIVDRIEQPRGLLVSREEPHPITVFHRPIRLLPRGAIKELGAEHAYGHAVVAQRRARHGVERDSSCLATCDV